jgi:hypothetical protein
VCCCRWARAGVPLPTKSARLLPSPANPLAVQAQSVTGYSSVTFGQLQKGIIQRRSHPTPQIDSQAAAAAGLRPSPMRLRGYTVYIHTPIACISSDRGACHAFKWVGDTASEPGFGSRTFASCSASVRITCATS